jgi:Glycosyl hydrolases family 18
MSTISIIWAWGTNTRIDFDPRADRLDFGWFKGDQFTVSEVDGSVVIAIPSNRQTYTLSNMTLAQLGLDNIVALDSSATEKWTALLDGTDGSPQPPTTPPVVPPTTPPATPPSHDATTTKISWAWGTNTHVDFHAATDKLDFDWFQADQFTISERNGSVVIAIPSNQQTYTLDHTRLADLHLSNIVAKDGSALNEWATVLGEPVAPPQPPVTPPGTPPTNPPSDTSPTGPFIDADPVREFTPYIDMAMSRAADLLAISHASGIKNFTLAFVLGSGHGIGWQGTGTIADDSLFNGSTILSQVEKIQTAGGNITISFGGANGQEAALTATDAKTLQAQYQSVIDRYHIDSIDFDIEGWATEHQRSIELRNEAIKGLQADNPDLHVSFTLPVLPTGLVHSGLNILRNAMERGVEVDVVNIMAMDYGPAVDNNGQMGTQMQLKQIGLDAKIGITPMIGVNDVASEIFTLADARSLLAYAQTDPDVARLSMWSVIRDNGDGAGSAWASPEHSGVAQGLYAYVSIFNQLDLCA